MTERYLHPHRPLIERDRWTWGKLAKRIKARDGWRCVLCGSDERLEVDHIVPRIAGGSDASDNLRTLCRRCHKLRIAGAEPARTGPAPTPLGPPSRTIFNRPKTRPKVW